MGLSRKRRDPGKPGDDKVTGQQASRRKAQAAGAAKESPVPAKGHNLRGGTRNLARC